MLQNNNSSLKIFRECNKINVKEICTDDNSLSSQEFDELNDFINSNHLEPENFRRNLDNTLTIINYVGYIQLPSVGIEILPKTFDKKDAKTTGKTASQVILNMLANSDYLGVDGYCRDEYFNLDKTLLDEDNNIFEIFSYLFARILQTEVSKGISASYVQQEDNLPILRGKLLMTKHIKNQVGKTGKAYCQYDEFSIDNDLNRFLKFVSKYLVKKSRRHQTVNWLKHCLLQIDEVDVTNFKFDVVNSKVKFDRTNDRFKQAFDLGNLLLAQVVSGTASHADQTFAMLFSMETLFEHYISCAVQQVLRNPVSSQHHEKYLFFGKDKVTGVYQIRPDIVIKDTRGREDLLIIDTKWKVISSDAQQQYKIIQKDFFQMYAYLSRYESVKVAVLLYPEDRPNCDTAELKAYATDKDKWLLVYKVNFMDKQATEMSLKKIFKEIKKNYGLDIVESDS